MPIGRLGRSVNEIFVTCRKNGTKNCCFAAFYHGLSFFCRIYRLYTVFYRDSALYQYSSTSRATSWQENEQSKIVQAAPELMVPLAYHSRKDRLVSRPTAFHHARCARKSRPETPVGRMQTSPLSLDRSATAFFPN